MKNPFAHGSLPPIPLPDLTEATRLTRGGRLGEATALIGRLLGREQPQVMPPFGPTPLTPPFGQAPPMPPIIDGEAIEITPRPGGAP
ncbi:hypothetical protein CKO10_16665, partial [Rhodospirillum rubrum]|nr:hypothetical protein [Rhodospirillum rubrum]